jgi:nitrite reductase/ring-hydroxylating ferredoxin subunit
MDYIKIATLKDFETESIKSFSLMGKKIGVIKQSDSSFRAIEVGCKHQGADLTKGEIVGSIATCHRHQWKYDLETGKCLTNHSPDLRKYGIKVEGENILVSFLPLEER